MKSILIVVVILAVMAVCERRPQTVDSKRPIIATSPGADQKKESSPNAAKADPDLQYLDTMIFHHENLIEIALLVNTRTLKPGIRKLADNLIADQRSELDRLRQMRTKWYENSPPAINLDLPGMRSGVEALDTDKLELLKADEFDREFIRLASALERSVIELSNSQNFNGGHEDLKEFKESAKRGAETALANIGEMSPEVIKP